MRMRWIAAVALLVGACSKEQSYREAMEMFCEAPTKIAAKEAGLAKCTVLEVWEEQLKNPPKLPDDPLNQPVPAR